MQVRAAILETDESAWQAALTQESSEREGARSASAPSASSSRPTGRVAPASSVAASVLTPARNLSFTDHDGHRFQCFITDQGGDDLATLEVHHRARARRGPLPRGAGVRVRQSPFREFGPKAVWLELALCAQDLLAHARALVLDGELARAEPKRLRYRLLRVAGRLNRSEPRGGPTTTRREGPGRHVPADCPGEALRMSGRAPSPASGDDAFGRRVNITCSTAMIVTSCGLPNDPG